MLCLFLICFLRTFNWKVSSLFETDGMSWADSNPYSSFGLSAASAVYALIWIGQSECLQKGSSFFMIAIVAANLLLISSLLDVFIPSSHPKYVADLCFLTKLLSGSTILAFWVVC